MKFTSEAAPMGDSRGFRLPRQSWPILAIVLLLGSILLGLVLATDYGMSADERENADVARLALKAYFSRPAYDDYMVLGEVLAHHGPSYFIPWEAGSRMLVRLLPGWHITDARHLINYLVYLVGLCFFFILAKRFMGRRSALMTTIFAGSQPLLFGHAFINQKDTPFWVFTLGSIVVGMAAVDAALIHTTQGKEPRRIEGLFRRIARVWRSDRSLIEWTGLLLIVLSAAFAMDVLTFEFLYQFAEAVLRQAHQRESLPFINDLFRAIAEDADTAGVEIYVAKLEFAYWRLRPLLIVLSLAAMAMGMRLGLPAAWRHLWQEYRGDTARFLGAGAVLGFTLGIRPVAGLAVILIGLYWLLRGRLRAAELAIPYTIGAGLMTYISWPYLWDAPRKRLLESVFFTGSFDGPTKYMGEIIRSHDLPWHYFPNYLATELTEPAVLLMIVGVVLTGVLWSRRRDMRPELGVLLLWVAVPLFGLIGLGMGIYDNLRHLLFVLIPSLVIAGIGLNWFMERLPTDLLRGGMLALMLAPGALGLIRLHPYQFIYFNSFIGGVERAADLHFVDRLCTSYREAMAYVNTHAGPEATVAFRRQRDVAKPFARGGIDVVRWEPSLQGSADYIVTCSFHIGEFDGEENWEKVYTVDRAGATLGEVYMWTGPPAEER